MAKTSLLLSLSDYIQWPKEIDPNPQAPVTISVLGDKALTKALEEAAEHRPEGKRPVIIKMEEHAFGIAGAKIIFFPDAGTGLAILRRTTALTVGEASDFIDDGGMIQLEQVGSRLRYRLNLPPIRHAGLGVDARVLRMAVTLKN